MKNDSRDTSSFFAKEPDEGQTLSVLVPASSANLGVGYDCLGVALDLWMRIKASPAQEFQILGGDKRYRNPDNLVWTSYLTTRRLLGLPEIPLSIEIDSDIPTTGGLGSSAACVVAGIVLAQALDGRAIDRQLSLDIANNIEGHPDNVAPALLGGLVNTFVREKQTLSTRYEVGNNLRFVVCAPQYEVRTHEARQALPKSVALDDVVWQMGRCVATVHALTSGDAELFGAACADRLHEPYRKGLIKDYEKLKGAALAAGADAFFISGSGSAMIALAGSPECAARVAEALKASSSDVWIKELAASARGAYVQ